MIWKLATAMLLVAVSLAFAWPWVTPHLERRDQPQRLLDALREEWERDDVDAPRYDGMPW